MRRTAVVLALIALISPFGVSLVTQASSGDRLQFAADQDTEVIAVEDITDHSDCVYTAESYADKEQTQLISSESYPCPLGSVLRAQRMTKSEAEEQGLPYVVSTGDAAEDEAAVDDLKWSIFEAIRGPAPEPPVSSGSDRALLGDCGTPTYRTRYLSYAAAGGRVGVGVRYHDVENSYPDGCDVIRIYESFSYLIEPIQGDLFWDEERYPAGINTKGWYMGCQEFDGSTNYTSMSWYGYPNYWFTDESIDDADYTCTFWGTEFTGMVVLDA